jgi:tetratricopeptide (TPR) repeat protein
MLIRIHFVLALLLIGFSKPLFSQFESRGDQYDNADALSFYNARNFYDALPLFEKLAEKEPLNHQYWMKIGICHLYLNQETEKATAYFKKASTNNPKTKNVNYYLARAYALNYQFEKAIETYGIALEMSSTEAYYKKRIPLLLAQCHLAIVLVKDTLALEIINIGKPINSSANEYCPIINATETQLIYTYRGERSLGGRLNSAGQPQENGSFNEDLHCSNFKNNLWTESISISDRINTTKDEACVAISKDGSQLYLYKDTKDAKGDIFESVKSEDGWSEPKRLNFNSKSWEGHATFSADGNRVVFSSNRPNGIGGKDLYAADLLADGTWGNVKNLGAGINTQYDEDSPFLHAAGGFLNFSSNGHLSMGGYDIFEAALLGDSAFGTPKNLGYPINTTSNDIFYTVLPNKNAYYSSGRRGGHGQNDIYLINSNGINISGVARLYKDPQSPISNLVVNISNTQGTFNLSDTTDGAGRYNFSKLPPGDDYVLLVEEVDETYILDAFYTLEGQVSKMEKPFDGSQVNNEETDVNGEYKLKITKKLKEAPLLERGADEDLLQKDKEAIALERGSDEERLKKAKEARALEVASGVDLMTEYGQKTAPGLIYKVQIAALYIEANFTEELMTEFGAIEKIKLDNGLTSFAVGNCTMLLEVTKLLGQLKKIGYADAFVIVFVDGKRTYLEELINRNTFED